MDNKPPSHLDPKMQERYAQIMGRTNETPQGDSTDQTASIETIPNTAGGQPLDSHAMETAPQAEQFSPNLASADTNTPPEAPTDSPFFSNSESTPDQLPPAETSDTNNTGETAAEAPQQENTFTPSAPVTPYATDAGGANPGAVSTSAFTKPLPSPADIAQNGPREASALLKVLYIVGAVVFFMIYTVFWIKVFNLPFLF